MTEGYPVQFVVLSDQNATDFVTRTSVPIFQDDGSGRPAWQAMEAGAQKHDTFVFSRAGVRTLYWDASEQTLSNFSTDIRTAVEAEGK